MAPTPPLVALQGASLRFGPNTLFNDLTLRLSRGDRACLVGRNGSGKSTLLKALAGEVALDGGTRFLQPGTRVAYLPQDPQIKGERSVEEEVRLGLGSDDQDSASSEDHCVGAILEALDLKPTGRLGTLSGGEARRVALAKALVAEPDVLLLDEPTNHLDLPRIAWLENTLVSFQGALLLVSHDRTFLTKVSRVTYWLDRGQVKRLDRGYAAFADWSEQELAREAEAQHRLDRKIIAEERWLARGVTARRKRNQGRLARLHELRETRAKWLKAPGAAKLAASTGERSGVAVIEAEHLSKAFASNDGENRVILRDFSTRIRRGDRIGIIGPNGAGKTTLVKLLIGELEPDGGTVRLGSGVTPIYFDQRRESLDPEATLWQTLVPDGGDFIAVDGRPRHVVSYLRDYLFDEGQARQPVKSLSGGERNRLLLARLLAQPSNLIVLDEPTNDLDLETLDLLAEVLDGYAGTVILVSHDRDFLDQLATGVIVMDGHGGALDVVGGYQAVLAQQAETADMKTPRDSKPKGIKERPARTRTKLTAKDQLELDRLPGQIEGLERDIADLESQLADPTLYNRDPEAFQRATDRLAECKASLEVSESRWLALEEEREALAASAARKT